MDQTTARAADAQENPSIGWPIPWWSLLAGGGFVALMTTPVGLPFGFMMIPLIAVLALPFIMIAFSIGGPAANYIAGGLTLATYVLAPALLFIRGIVKAPDRRARTLLLNGLVLWLAFLAGIVVSVRAVGETWFS